MYENPPSPLSPVDAATPLPVIEDSSAWLVEKQNISLLNSLYGKIGRHRLLPDDEKFIHEAVKHFDQVHAEGTASPAVKLPTPTEKLYLQRLPALKEYLEDRSAWIWRWTYVGDRKIQQEQSDAAGATKMVYIDSIDQATDAETIEARHKRLREIADKLLTEEIKNGLTEKFTHDLPAEQKNWEQTWSAIIKKMLEQPDKYNFADTMNVGTASPRLKNLLTDIFGLSPEAERVFFVQYFNTKGAPVDLLRATALPQPQAPIEAVPVLIPILQEGVETPVEDLDLSNPTGEGKSGWGSRIGKFFKRGSSAASQQQAIPPLTESTDVAVSSPEDPQAVIDQAQMSEGKKRWLKNIAWGGAGAVTSLAFSLAGINQREQMLFAAGLGSAGYLPRFWLSVTSGEVMRNSTDGYVKAVARKVFDAVGSTLTENQWLTSFLTGFTLANATPLGEIVDSSIHQPNMSAVVPSSESSETGATPTAVRLQTAEEISTPRSPIVSTFVPAIETHPTETSTSTPTVLPSITPTETPLVTHVEVTPEPTASPEATVMPLQVTETPHSEIDLSNPMLGPKEPEVTEAPRIGIVDLNNPMLGPKEHLVPEIPKVGEVDLNNPDLGSHQNNDSSKGLTPFERLTKAFGGEFKNDGSGASSEGTQSPPATELAHRNDMAAPPSETIHFSPTPQHEAHGTFATDGLPAEAHDNHDVPPPSVQAPQGHGTESTDSIATETAVGKSTTPEVPQHNGATNADKAPPPEVPQHSGVSNAGLTRPPEIFDRSIQPDQPHQRVQPELFNQPVHAEQPDQPEQQPHQQVAEENDPSEESEVSEPEVPPIYSIDIEPTKFEFKHPWAHFVDSLSTSTHFTVIENTSEALAAVSADTDENTYILVNTNFPQETNQALLDAKVVPVSQVVDPIKDVFNAINVFIDKSFDPDCLKSGSEVIVLNDEVESLADIQEIAAKHPGVPIMLSTDQQVRLGEYVIDALHSDPLSRTPLQEFVISELNDHPHYGGDANAIFAADFASKHPDELEQLLDIATANTD